LDFNRLVPTFVVLREFHAIIGLVSKLSIDLVGDLVILFFD
jgi:deoxyinosine 3'endonuclease (endonuclease V)